MVVQVGRLVTINTTCASLIAATKFRAVYNCMSILILSIPLFVPIASEFCRKLSVTHQPTTTSPGFFLDIRKPLQSHKTHTTVFKSSTGSISCISYSKCIKSSKSAFVFCN